MKISPLLVLIAGPGAAWAVSDAHGRGGAAPQEEEAFACGACFALDEAGTPSFIPLESTEVILDVKPGLMEAEVVQTFSNRGDRALEAVYRYPLPPDATLTHFELRVGDRVIVSEVREKAQAKAVYEAAKAEGRKTALLEQEDPACFSTSAANFLPGETVKTVLRFIQPLAVRADSIDVRFPMVTGTKYFPAGAVPGAGGNSAAPPIRAEGMWEPGHVYAFDIQVSGVPVESIRSESHRVRVESLGGERHAVSLEEEITIPNRDFVLRIETRRSAALAASWAMQRTRTGSYGLLTVFPPETIAVEAPRQPRDILFLIDQSGSMDGQRLESAKKGLAACLTTFRSEDRFQIVRFSSTHAFYSPSWVPGTVDELARARQWVRGLRTEGGTEFQPALEASLAAFNTTGRDHVLIALTDGDVGNEKELVKLVERKVGDARVFTLGIGAAPNPYLIRKLAESGRGQARFVDDDASIARELADLVATLEASVLVGVKAVFLDESGAPVEHDAFPERLPDVFLGRPIQTVARFTGAIPVAVRIEGQRGNAPYTATVPLTAVPLRGDGLEKLYGARWIESLEALARQADGAEAAAMVRAELLATALQFQLVTELTSRVAVDRTVSRRPGDSLESVAVPQAVPVDQGGEAEEMIIVLTPFTVDASKDTGYRATQTLAGTRIATELADVGSSISVLTSEFLRDINGTNNETTLAYAVSTEVGGARGNYSGGVSVQGNALGGAGDETAKMANPNQNTRVRGLTAADNTRNMFLNDIPWDIYNVGRVDLQRGPNSMLFGLGSPAGIINVTINSAEFRDRGTIGASYDQFGSIRMSLDYNKELIDQQLALRVQYLDNNQKFRQEPAFSDDTRYFAAAAFAPEMLNREGMVFTVNANFEKGKIVSNRPRYIAPMDAMTRFFAPRSEGGVNRQTADHLNGNVLDNRSPSFNPAYSEFFTYDPVYDVETNTWELHRPIQMGSRMTDGSIWLPRQGDNGPWPGPYANELRMGGMAEFAARSNLAFSDFGSYTWFESLQDPSVFDFYNKLIDGDNKREFTDWDVLDINIAHTFFDGKVGCNLAYFNQKLVQDQWAMLGWGATLHVDVNSYDNVFTYNPEARGGVGLVANPNAGRVYVSQPVNFTNPCLESNREAGRFQAFVNHDFAKGNKTFLNRLLGEHRVTASVARETQSTDSRSRRTWQFDLNSMRNFASNAVVGDKGGRHIGVTSGGDAFVTDWRYYLSEDVRSRSSAVGLNLPNMTRTFLGKGGSAEVWKFDNTWTAGPSVDPNAFWQNPNPEATAPGVSHYWRQAANPFNYQGWYNAQGQRNMVPVNVVTLFSDQLVEGMTAKDYLTVDAELMETIDDSFTAVWQACFWDKAVVGTFGYRHDEVEVDQYGSGRTRTPSHEHPITQGADVDPNRYRLDGVADRTGTVDQTNWSVVAHLNRFLGDNDFIPINVSVLYNHGENAQPRFGRVDMIGDPLPAPVGDTDEWGLRLSTKDEKYSLQIAKYETISIKQDSTQNLSATYVIEQMMSGCANLARGFRSGANGYDSYYNWADPNRLYPREYERLMTRVIPDWILFEQQIQERWPGFVAGWIKGPWGSATDNGWVSCAQPWGFARTETAQSKGWEIEFVANPLENWRIMANAAQMEARRYEVMGTKAREVMDFIIDQVNSDDRVFGDTPIWWPGNNRVFSPPGYVNEFGYGPTFGGRGGLRGTISPYGDFKREWQMILALEGQKARELREWRFNLVSTYDFQSGALEGVSVGGGYRWEDGSVIGYAPEYRQPSGAAVYRRPYVDLDAPVETDSNGTLDLWLGKTFKLSAKMTWRVQLNVNNVFGRNELEAVSTGVDAVALQSMGTIEPDTVIPMRDGIMLIREGRSWTLSSTLEF